MYEAGFSGFWLYDRLTADGIGCIVTPASRVTMEKVNRVKTDKRDARRLAKNLENGDYVICHVPDVELREDRQVSRTLQQYQRDIIRTKNHIRRMLDFHGLNDGFPAGVWNRSHYDRLSSLKLSRSLQICLDTHIDHLKHLEAIRNTLLLELKSLCTKARYYKSVESKKSVPGIGWQTAIRLTLEWGDLSRFPSEKHIASYAGLTAREYSTGETIRRGRITGQGSASVRSWLIQCAWRARRLDPVLLHKYQSVYKNTGSKKKAIVAVARKMTVRIRAVELSPFKYSTAVIE